MRQRLDDAEIFGMRVYSKLRFKAMTLTLTGNITIDADSPPILNIDPGGAIRTITLPATEDGLIFIINHIGGAFDITINNASASGIGTISQNEAGVVLMVGTVAYLRLVGTST
jgi:hypothetical protein